jgi:hypothetical protein
MPPFERILPKDAYNNAMQSGNGFQTQDDTDTPQTSPLAYSSSVITIKVPTAAIEMILFPTTDLLVSDVANMATYDLITGDTKESLPCAGQRYIYLKRSTVDGSLRFRFTMI